jgi:hypothetical protein
VLGNPQNISDVVKAKEINLSIDVLINVMNATLDFNQVVIAISPWIQYALIMSFSIQQIS